MKLPSEPALPDVMDRLIIILLLRSEYAGNRDEAAMDLAEFDNPLAERALIEVASDPQTDGTTAYSCGLSLAEIWVRQGRFPVEAVGNFGKDARFGVREGIGGKPEWLERLNIRAA